MCFENAIQGYLRTGMYTREQSVREIAHKITLWRETLCLKPKRSDALLKLMTECYNNTDRQYDSRKHSSSRDYIGFLPRTDIKLCVDCFAVAADAADILDNGKVRRGAMFKLTLKAFNRQDTEVHYPTQSEMNDKEDFMTQEARVWIWLKQWLPGNTDTTPFNAEKLHLEAPSKKYVYDEMIAEWKSMNRKPASYGTFIKVLAAKFKIILHKHKKFAECQVCSLYKELWAKSKHANPRLRTEIKELRRTHLGVQYNERVEYYTAREQSFQFPEDILCIIVDAMTEGSTSVPLQRRESKGFDKAALKTQLVGALVHGPEGFYGYTVNGLKGARTTCEVVHRTLMKLAKTRKVWPRNFVLQLDNTSAENKNHTVMAYCAWLVATGVFETVQVRFLMVGHTHEDIDGYFGLLRRFLMLTPKGEKQHTSHSTQQTAQSTAHSTQHRAQHTAHITQHTARSTQHTTHSTHHTAHSTPHTAHITPHTAQHTTQHTAHSTQHTAHNTQHTIHRCTAHSTQHTTHSTQHTAHSTYRAHSTQHTTHTEHTDHTTI
jgi:hypothetical protein